MPELADGSVQLMVTSPPYPMIKMWDDLFAKADPKIAESMEEIGNGWSRRNCSANLRCYA